jgi:hypothetical protein
MEDKQTIHVPTFPQTAPANDSSCYPWIKCSACWETNWSHLMCEGDWWIHCEKGNIIVLKHKVMRDSLYGNAAKQGQLHSMLCWISDRDISPSGH